MRLFQIAFREFAYIVTEYKPTHGTVFADYLKAYSHWSYTDIDMLMGDLPLHIERYELQSYHIFSYHFGDVYRLYLRGQVVLTRPEVTVTPTSTLARRPDPNTGSARVASLPPTRISAT